MATVIAKTYVIPVIVAVRTTVAGDQYTVETSKYTDTVTINGVHITCIYHEAHCSHIQAVGRRRLSDLAQAAVRAACHLLFDLNYGNTLA